MTPNRERGQRSEPRDRSEPSKRRARARVGEFRLRQATADTAEALAEACRGAKIPSVRLSDITHFRGTLTIGLS